MEGRVSDHGAPVEWGKPMKDTRLRSRSCPGAYSSYLVARPVSTGGLVGASLWGLEALTKDEGGNFSIPLPSLRVKAEGKVPLYHDRGPAAPVSPSVRNKIAPTITWYLYLQQKSKHCTAT